MKVQLRANYEGRVQGVGFRYSTKQVAQGYEITGAVRNLPDGRVELMAEGEKPELEAFLDEVAESHLKGFIKDCSVSWHAAEGLWKGFEIAS